MKRNIFYLFVYFLINSCTSCKDKTPTPLEQLPPITQTGENTFGCLINGEPAFTKLYDNLVWGEGVEFIDLIANYGHMIISARTKNNNLERHFWFSINVPPPLQLTNYIANITTNDDKMLGCYCTDRNKNIIYSSDSSLPANVRFTNYTGNQGILSGTFEMTLLSHSTNDTIKITNGRFDIKYQ